MVTAASRPNHTHRFEIKGTRGTCKCGEIREYIYSSNPRDNTFKVIQAGDPNYQDEKRQIVVDHTDEIINELTGSTVKPTENMTENMPDDSKDDNSGKIITHDRPNNRDGYRKWMDERKDQILKDYNTMGIRDFLHRWHITSATWKHLKERWGVAGKLPRKANKKAKAQADSLPTEKAGKVTDTLDELALDSAINIDITWDFLNSLGDEDFNRLWAAVGVIVQVQAKKRVEG